MKAKKTNFLAQHLSTIITLCACGVSAGSFAQAATALTWSGTNSSAWDVDLTSNWNAGAAKFSNDDTVTFADSPTNATVTITGSVSPGSIAFTNASTAYTLRGGLAPVIAGSGTFTKSGAGLLTMWHPANSYSGGTIINGGTISLNNAAAVATGNYSPLGTGLITLNGGTLQINPANGGANTYTFPNAITLNGGTLYHNDGICRFSGIVTVTAASKIRTLYNGKPMYLDGGLAGSAPITISDQGGTYGAGVVRVTKDGTYNGTITLNAVDGDNGGIYIEANNAIEFATVVINTNNSSDYKGLTLAGAATNVTIASLSGTQAAARVRNADATIRTFTVNQATDTNFAGGIGDGTANGNKINLVKSGGGTLTLSNQDSYSGSTTVSAGKLVLASRNIPTMNITVADGAALGVNSTTASMFINDLTLGSAGATTLEINSFPANAAVPVIDCFTLNANSTTTLSISGSLPLGDYPIISFIDGPIDTSAFVLAPLPRGVEGNLSNSGTSINLNITKVDQLIWKGDISDVWDINSTANWKLGTTNPDKYLNGDNVLFDGSATTTAVVLDTSVAPASVTFAGNSTTAYSVIGTGSITGATGITKNGSGSLTIETANSYSGVFALNNGTLILGSPTALGNTTSGTNVGALATLDLNGQTVGGESLGLSGILTNGSVNSAALSGAISINDDSSFDGNAGNFTISGTIAGSAFLEKNGSNTVTLTNASPAFTGTVEINDGTLVFGIGGILPKAQLNINEGGTVLVSGNNALLGRTGLVRVKSGGTLTIQNGITSNIGVSPMTLEGGALLAGSNPEGYYGSWTINNGGTTSIINVVDGDAVAAEISAKSVTPAQPTLNLNVADVTGNDDVDLIFSGTMGSTYNHSFSVKLTGAGTTQINGTNTNSGITTVALESTLAGTGTLNGNLTVTGTVAPGIDGLGTFTSKSLTLTGTYDCDIEAEFCDVLAITGDADISGSTLALKVIGAPTASSYIIATYTGDMTGSFNTVTGAPLGYSIAYDTTNKQIKLVKPGASGFDSWADSWTSPALADKSPGGDPDGDGVKNLLEYILGGDPRVSDLSILPSQSVVGGNLVLSYKRNDNSSNDTTQVGEWSTDLSTWNGAIAPVIVNDNGAAADDVTISVPTANAANGRLFIRLKATK